MLHHAPLSAGNQPLVVRTAARFLAAASLGLALQLIAAPEAAACPQDDATVQDQDAQKQDAKKEAAKKEAAKQDAAKQGDAAKKGPVGRSRLSGRGAPPKPAAIPSSRPSSGGATPTVKLAPVQGVGAGAPGAKAAQKSAVAAKPKPAAGSPVQMTPEQRKYEEKLKQAQPKKPTAAPRPPRNPNAKLEIPFGMDKHDFGRAQQGDLLMHTFKLQSNGTEPVVISQASPTCGCTLGEVKVLAEGQDIPELYSFGSPIAPGSEIQISATLDTKSKKNKTNVRINVYSNDGKTGVTMLSLAANVEPFLVASPPFLQFGQIREGTERTGTIDFRTSTGERIMLSEDATRPIPLPAGLSMDFGPINPDESGKASVWRATFTVGKDSPEGGKSYAVRLDSDVELPKNDKLPTKAAAKPGAPTVYQVTANVNYTILGAISLQTQYLSLGLVRPDQPVVRDVRLTCHEADFDLSNVKATLTGEGNQPLQWEDRFKVSVKPVSGSNAVDIELRLTGLPEDADGSFRGRVLIETGHPTKPTDFVRFSGVCRKTARGVARPAASDKKEG
ncbi:MAG: DUF1573 domain-containing protein [Planctomycetes bacterium]|nr:DUF1573 domain-containing protein [Planctomycetota bacterium]